MHSFFKHLLFLVLSLSFLHGAYAQTSVSEESLKGWHLKDQKKDQFYGISLTEAYDFLKEKKITPQTVIVAVIDSGIDTLHEDLKPVLWKNSKEIPGNGKDDDNNGYADDIYGWNFIGGKDGKNVNEDSYEAARVYHSLKEKYNDKTESSKLSKADKKEYEHFLRAKNNLESSAKEAAMNLLFLNNLYDRATKADSILKNSFKEEFTGDELMDYQPEYTEDTDAKNTLLTLFRAFDMMNTSNGTMMNDFISYYKGEKKKTEQLEKSPVAYRADIVKDIYTDFKDQFYGNADVMAGRPSHGTHVSGIIGAVRNNGLGMNGVADQVQIMSLRAVPDGDEHDKDIALAIRYAVNNGAKIINMSFGKSFSPQKHWVDEAVRYAQKKGVLLVHAAGNDGKDLDAPESFNYPTSVFADNGKVASNYITVGASGDLSIKDLAADFSNYGAKNVDVFAPGMKIYATLPGGNVYGFQQGTSMASPVVAGLSALLLSYFPTLSAEQIKECIEKTVTIPETETTKPGTEEEKVAFKKLSKTGGIVNAYAAVQYASTLKGKRKTSQLQK